MISWLLAILTAYVAGSIPFGVILARTRGIDIRSAGSRNIGATNVGRVLGRKFGLLCFALDFLKGALPVLISGAVHGCLGQSAGDLTQREMWLWLAVAAAAVLGHMYSIFLGFAGGKGVATGFGAIVAMYPLLTWPALAAIGVWYAAVRVTRYVAVASILAAWSLPFTYALGVLVLRPMIEASTSSLAFLHASPPLLAMMVLAALVTWRHRGNIARLRRGEEPRAGDPIPPAQRPGE